MLGILGPPAEGILAHGPGRAGPAWARPAVARPWPGRPAGLAGAQVHFPSAFFVCETKCILKKSTFGLKQQAKLPFLENAIPARIRAQIEQRESRLTERTQNYESQLPLA